MTAAQPSPAKQKPASLLDRLYAWVMTQAVGPRAVPALAIISFAESSFFPIPPDVMLVPMCLADRRRAFFFAAVCSVSSIVGGLFGYAIGYFLYETVGRAIIDLYGLENAFQSYQSAFAEWGLWIILIKGLTPIPYKIVTIASGVAKFDIVIFVLASIATRATRFFLEAWLLWRFGPPIRSFIEEKMVLLTWIFFILLIGGFVVVKYFV